MAADSYELRNCSFAFECTQSWSSLQHTQAPGVRHCLQCSQDVHLCETSEAVTAAINANRCIAVRLPTGKKRLGKPSPPKVPQAPLLPKRTHEAD